MKRTFRIRLLFGFGVGLVSMLVIREFLETTFGLVGPPVLFQSVAIGGVAVVFVAVFRQWKPLHVLCSLGMTLVGAIISLIVLFSQITA